MKKGIRIVVVAATLVALSTSTAMAANVLYYKDGGIGTDEILAALTARGDTVTTATSFADFNTKLAGGGFNLAIPLTQFGGTGFDTNVLHTFMTGGGTVITTIWINNGAVNASYAAAFGTQLTGNNNLTPATIGPAALTAGITNPIALSNPGYSIAFSMGLRTTGSGVSLGTWPNGDSSLIVANRGRSYFVGWLTGSFGANPDGSRFFQNLIAFALANGAAASVEPVPALRGYGLAALIGLLAAVGALVIARGKLFS